jgi:argonaute-like protein implicated in RNA metabolism and viral defense
MAIYSNKKWVTKQGVYYSKRNTAYLCATDPKEVVGMAQPIKIVQKTNGLSIHEIVSDIYKLSFMHIHSMLKTRLPITIHYADLSSTFHNRGLIHPRSQHERALPFV